MSVLKTKGKSPSKMTSLVLAISDTLKSQAGDFSNSKQVENLLSMESLDGATAAGVEQHFSNTVDTISDIVKSIGFGDDVKISAVSLEAASIAAMAAGNPVAYAEAAMRGQAKKTGDVTMVEVATSGSAGRLDYRDRPAMEAFDERELRDHLPYSVAFNVFASRQDDFSEAFFPTVVVAPDQAGLDVSVSRMQVFNEVRHNVTGKAVDFGKKNLIDAAVDAEILADESTALVPHKPVDNSNNANFVPATAVATLYRTIAGATIPTAPLLMGRTVDLLGLSHFAPLIGAGILDNTDSVDNGIALSAVYLLPATGAKAVKFNVSKLPRTSFTKSVEGDHREMNLTFASDALLIDKDTRAVDGTVVTEFADIATGEYTVFLEAKVNGTVNVETGNAHVFAPGLTVTAILDTNGNSIALDAGAGATIVAAIQAMTLIGYDLAANRTNSNRRTRGLQLDTNVQTARYSIPLGAPISVPSSASSSKDATDLKALIAASRIRNSNNAVTALLNYGEQLKAYVKGPKRKGVVPAVAGMGRFLVEPFFEEHELDLELAINSIKSHEKAADVSAVLINACRDVAYRMYRDSKYQAALDALTGGAGEVPTLVIGTDQVLIRHLITSGDTRTFGAAFEKFALVSSLDKRMKNKIVLSFVRQGVDGPDPLSCGTHAWIPELASTMPVSRNGAQIKESMVQPRTLHVNNLPVMAIINVENLTKVLSGKISTPATATDITNPYLDGLTYP